MKKYIYKFLNYNLPLEERLLYIVTFMCTCCSLFLFFLGVSFSLLSVIEIAALAVIFALSLGIFCLEYFFKKTKAFSHAYLTILNLVLFPIVFLFSDINEFDIPVYSLICLVYALILTKDKARLGHFTSQIIIYLGIFAYRYYSLYRKIEVFEGLSYNTFIKVEISIFITCILVGTVIFYRNWCLDKELEVQAKINEQAEISAYAKDMFLVNVSHEIRTPLNAIIGTTNIVLDSDAGSNVKGTIYNISNASNALLAITNDLLDFSNMSNDDIVISNDSYDLSALLKDIINLTSVSVLDLGFDFYADINPELPVNLIGDSTKLRQVIVNFITNAAKYTKVGFVNLIVDFNRIDDTEIELLISVKDTGEGMKPETVRDLLKPVNAYSKTEFNISSVGISLVKKIAEAMDATFDIKSENGQGAEFIFNVKQKVFYSSNLETIGTLDSTPSVCLMLDRHPDSKRLVKTLESMNIRNTEVYSDNAFLQFCAQGSFDYYFIDSSVYSRVKDRLIENKINWNKLVVIASCNNSFANEPFSYVLTRPVSALNISDLINKKVNSNIKKNSYRGSFAFPKAKVLIVDDNLINLEVTEGLLSRFKCKVVKATSGSEGILCIQNEDIDLVLLDYMMPEMDGIDTLKIIKSMDDGKYKDLPVIAFTANAVSGARKMFKQEGFNDYIAKPIDMERLSLIFLENIPDDKIEYIL